MKTNDWNPELYLRFGKERIQPSIDLVTRIDFNKPRNIIDIGCGPGNSTQILADKWPNTKIVGVDNSISMIEKAKKDYPNQEWIIMDAGKDKLNEKFDIVFSNATIQWIPDHKNLFNKFYNMLKEGGLLAIQLPLFFDMPLGKSIAAIAENEKWAHLTKEVTDLFTIHNSITYYDYLSELYQSIEMWETNYVHIMESQESILKMISSTGLRPYLEKLDNKNDIKDFEEKVLKGIKRDYPVQKNGNVLFPFNRLFFIAKK